MDEGPAAAMEERPRRGAPRWSSHTRIELGQRAATRHQTRYFARNWRELHGLYHRVELFNGSQLFGWVAEQGLRPVAAGDLHRAGAVPRLDDAGSLRARRAGARRLPAARTAGLPDAARAAHALDRRLVTSDRPRCRARGASAYDCRHAAERGGYARPATLGAGTGVLAEYPGARALAGGADAAERDEGARGRARRARRPERRFPS